MEIGTEISKKIRAAIKTKLEELGAYVDEELPDYIMVMVANKKTQEQMQTDLSLFLGEAADSFTDWLSELLNKLQNITAETLEKQFKAQQRAEKTGQGSNSERVLMSLEKKKKDVESVAAAAAVASAKKAKTASDQPPTGDYIAIQTDDVIEGLEEEEIDPPAAKQSRPSSANSRPHSSSSSKKGNDPSHKEPPSLVEARQALDDALRKKRTGEVPNKVEMPKKLLKTSSSTTVASKRHQKESAAASSSAGKPSSKTSQQQQEGAKFIPGSVLKERDVDEDGRIIGSIVKVTDKKGKSLLQSKVSAIGGSSKTLASSSYRLRSSATANPVSTIKSSRGDVSSRIPSTRGMRSDNILRRSEVVARDRDRDPPVDRDRRQQRRSRSGERDASPSPPALLSTRAQKPNRDDAAYRDYDRPTRSDSGYARDPESKMYSDVKPTRDRPHEYIPLTTRQDDHSKDAMPSQNHDSRRDQHDGRHSSRIDNKEPDMKPQFSSRRGDAEATMGPPSGDLMKPPRRRHRQSDEKKDASDLEKRSRSKSGEKAAAATTTSAVAGQKEPSPDPQKDNPAFLLKKDNGKTVTVTRAHLQSFKVHIKNRKRHPSDEISCAVDGYSVIGGDLEGGGRGGNSGGGVPPRLSANDDFILSKTIPNEPEPYEEDEEDLPTEGEGEETRDENTEEREYDDRVSETNLGSPARYSDVEEEERGEPSSSPLPVLMGARSFRNVRPKSPSPFEEEESSLLDDEWEQQLQQEQEHLQQQHLRQLQQADERRFQRSGRRKSENTVEERQRVEEPAERVEETAQEVPPYESEEEGEPVPPPVIKRTAASTRQSLGETEPEPPGTEGRILLPHEQAAEDKRKAKEQKARERAERREKLKRRKAEKAAAAAAADAARAKAAAEEAARAKAAAKAEAAAEAAEAAKRAKKPVKISTDLLQAELEMSDWQDIVSKALDSKSLEDVGSQDDEDFQLAEEQASSKAGQKGSKKLKRPPPKNGSAPQRQQRRRQQSQQQQPSSPPSSQSPSDLNQESPKFLITFDGVDADKFAADDHDDDEIANSLVGGQKSKQTRNDAVEREKEKDEGMVLLDGFAEDDVFYIDADDVVEDDAEALSALVSGRTSPVTLSYVSSNQTLYSASDLSLPSEKGENELVKPSRSGAKISLPVRPKATKTAAVAAATDIAAARDATSTPAAAPPLAKATASVAPQVNGEKNQFTWQNPNAAVAAFAAGIGGNRNVTVAPRNLQATNARLNAARQVAMAPLRNVFSIPRSNQIPMRQVQSFAPPVPGNPPHSSTDRCRFWPACRAGEGCPYQHPTKPCKAFPNCKFGDKCLFIHPNCKYDATCTKLACPFTHASKRGNLFAKPIVKTFVVPARRAPISELGAQMPCRYGVTCAKPDCAFSHPRARRAPSSKIGAAGEEMSTEMAERILNFPTKLVWKKD